MKIKPTGSERFLPALSGAAFLMATSAIGPGFITQTTVFTQKLFTSFGFIILLSIVIDLVVQLNIWRMISVTQLQAPELANKVFPGLGIVLIILVSSGGLVFNIGNIAGCGLAVETLFGVNYHAGAVASCCIAIIIFLNKEFGKSMDAFTKMLGFVMIALMLFTAIKSQPPIADIVYHSFIPATFDFNALITIVGGTVGGYISFAGAHRMLDASKNKPLSVDQTDGMAIQGIALASLMRILLFIATAGVVASGIILSASNPAADVFKFSAGNIGMKLFGVVLWAASITSVIGAAYTSITFLQTLHPFIGNNRRWVIMIFIIISTIIFVAAGNPVNILVKAGAVNGIILPLSLSIMLIGSGKANIIQSYKHPAWLIIGGWLVVGALGIISVKYIAQML